MEIQCPNCQSRFNFSIKNNPDKLTFRFRCSVCKHVFSYQPPQEKASQPNNTSLDNKIIIIIVSLILFVLIFVGSITWLYFEKFPQEQSVKLNATTNLSLLKIQNIKQYAVENSKIGRVLVVEGSVFNGSLKTKEFIAVEATLYDKERNIVSSKKQICGTKLTTLQLQINSEDEMNLVINEGAKFIIQPGIEIPFMVVFPNPPEIVFDSEVQIVEAFDVE